MVYKGEIKMRVVVDAFGGDHAPLEIIKASIFGYKVYNLLKAFSR